MPAKHLLLCSSREVHVKGEAVCSLSAEAESSPGLGSTASSAGPFMSPESCLAA